MSVANKVLNNKFETGGDIVNFSGYKFDLNKSGLYLMNECNEYRIEENTLKEVRLNDSNKIQHLVKNENIMEIKFNFDISDINKEEIEMVWLSLTTTDAQKMYLPDSSCYAIEKNMIKGFLLVGEKKKR